MDKKDGRKNNGGKRPGSGAPEKEATFIITSRLRKKEIPIVRAFVKKLVAKRKK